MAFITENSNLGNFTSRNRDLGVSNTQYNTMTENKELPTKTFLKTLYTNDALKLAGKDNRPASAIPKKHHNSYTKISDKNNNSKSSFLNSDPQQPRNRSKPRNYQFRIPENFTNKMCKRKRSSRRRFKKKPKPLLWQYKENQLNMFLQNNAYKRPVSARTLFYNNLSKK